MINKLDDENDGLTDFFWAIFHDNKENNNEIVKTINMTAGEYPFFLLFTFSSIKRINIEMVKLLREYVNQNVIILTINKDDIKSNTQKLMLKYSNYKLFKENGNHSNLIDDDKIILGILYNGKENTSLFTIGVLFLEHSEVIKQ
ncbi:hypothetical protein U3516DRAFT_745694 [Neocallimastix sp. 'constans']